MRLQYIILLFFLLSLRSLSFQKTTDMKDNKNSIKQDFF